MQDYMIAEKNGSRILHLFTIGHPRFALAVADPDWAKVVTFSKEAGLAKIAELKTLTPFKVDGWKFELVRREQFELAAPLGRAPHWFRIKKTYPGRPEPAVTK